jgi:CBS domain-containing protein
MKVSEIMTLDVGTCSPGDRLQDVAKIMWERDCGVVPVVDDADRVLGMITDRDVCMAAYTQGRPLREIEVSSVMAHVVHTCHAGDSLAAAQRIMRAKKVRRLPVTDADGRLTGILSLNDIAREAARGHEPPAYELSAEGILDTFAAICEPRAPREGAAQMTG